MPDDSNGIYNVPIGTLVNSGDTVLPSQHNPWANDSATAISNRFSKDGRAPATGNWNLNSFSITNLGTPVASGDAVNKSYADATYTTPAALALKLDILQPSVDVASAATTDIGAASSQNVRITGTTTITSLGTAASGTFRRVRFSGILTLTYNATSLVLPTSANITTASGDYAEFVSDGSGNWRCVSYERASGAPLVLPIGVNQVWQTVIRSISTIYTNDTGRPIQISVRVTAPSTASAGSATLTVAGVNVAIVTLSESNGTIFNPLAQTLTAIIPPGAVYAVTGTNASISSWSELR